ncbi:hypothetical protein TNCV_523621 [Trichonephila clavipes]|nr:hypothetical protein TNCV_523621 [Trichonephila clavipes]
MSLRNHLRKHEGYSLPLFVPSVSKWIDAYHVPPPGCSGKGGGYSRRFPGIMDEYSENGRKEIVMREAQTPYYEAHRSVGPARLFQLLECRCMSLLCIENTPHFVFNVIWGGDGVCTKWWIVTFISYKSGFV